MNLMKINIFLGEGVCIKSLVSIEGRTKGQFAAKGFNIDG
jgi:hypothetical protein